MRKLPEPAKKPGRKAAVKKVGGVVRKVAKMAPAKAPKKAAKLSAAPVKAKRKPRPKVVEKAAPKVVQKVAPVPGFTTPSRIDLFVLEYMLDLNGRQAAIRAGYKPSSARQTASDLLLTGEVQLKLAKAMVERAQRTEINADKVLERWWAIATADARALTELHWICCRHCWGDKYHYQRTPHEMREAVADYEERLAVAKEDTVVRPVDVVGGEGYDPRKEPNPACPECFGQGEQRVVSKDTRDLSPEAAFLFAGVKTTQHGLEVKTHSQADALTKVGQHLGMLNKRVELSGAGGTDLEFGVVVLPAKVPPKSTSAEPPPAPVAAALAEVPAEPPTEPRAVTDTHGELAAMRKLFQVRAFEE